MPATTTPAASGHDDAEAPQTPETAPAAVSEASAVRSGTRRAMDRFNGALFGAGMLLAAASATPATAADQPATIPVKPLPAVSEVARFKLDGYNFAAHDPFLTMLQTRLKEPIYFNPRDGEKPVAPIRTRADLGSLIDGARDMPRESARDILGTDAVTAANIADALERLLDPAKYPSLVSFRTVSRDGGKAFSPIFEPGTATPRPGMEADAKRILDGFAGQYRNIVEPIRAGKVPAETLADWAMGMNGVVKAIPADIMGRATLHRAAVNGYLGIKFQQRGYEAQKKQTGKGINHLLAKPKTLTTMTAPSGREIEQTVYEPSGRAATIASTAVELARLTGSKQPGTEYYARLRIGTDDQSVKVGDLALGDGLVDVMNLTGTTKEFWSDVLTTAKDETAIGILWDNVKKNPRIQTLLASETPDTVRQWAPAMERGLGERADSKSAWSKSLDAVQDVRQVAVVSHAFGSVGRASYAVAGAYYLSVYDRYKKAGRATELDKVLPAFPDGNSVRRVLDVENAPLP